MQCSSVRVIVTKPTRVGLAIPCIRRGAPAPVAVIRQAAARRCPPAMTCSVPQSRASWRPLIRRSRIRTPAFVTQVMAEAQPVGVDPRLFIAETAESGYGTSTAATKLDNPFGLKDRGGNENFSSNVGPGAADGAAILAEGSTLSRFVNTWNENLYQMYSGYGGIAQGGSWLRKPSYCQVSAGFVGPNSCQQFGGVVAAALTKMGGDPTNLKYPSEVEGTKCH
jgi:hypothetical protein